MNIKNKLLVVILIATLCFITISCINAVSAKEITGDYTLEADSTEAIVVKSGSNVTIDLNGYDLTVNGDAITVEKGATAIIKGVGSVVNSTKGAVVNLGGTVTIESGKYNSSTWYTVKNLANMTINGGEFSQGTNNTSNASLIANGWYNGLQTGDGNDKGVTVPTGNEPVAILTINGGTFTQYTTTSTIKSDDWSKTTINSGEFTSVNGTLIQVTGDVVVTGGKYKGFRDISLFYGNGSEGYEATRLNISGGDFDAKYITRTCTTGTLTITGGTFKNLTDVQNSTDKKAYTKTIIGGTYNIDVKDEITSGYSTYKTEYGYDVAKAGEISVESDEIVIAKGLTKDLGISVNNNLEKYLTISSNDDSVVSVKDNKITANKAGKAIITASLSNGTSKQISVAVYEIIAGENTDEVNDTKQIVNDIVNQVINGKDVAGLTEEQKQAIETAVLDGKKLVVDVDSTIVDSKEIEEDASKVEALIKDNAKIAGYYNIDIVIKDNDGNEITKLSQLNKAVQITVSIPKGISEVQEGYTRKYTIIRVHDGVAEELETIYKEDGTLTFSSDKYSTYAITYVDTLDEEIVDDTKDDKEEENIENPVTGDNIIVYIALLSFGVLGMAISIKIRNKK